MTALRVTHVMGGLVVLGLSVSASTVSAQSLADIAKKAGSQPRAAASRVLTNQDLPPADDVVATPLSSADPTPAVPSSATATAASGQVSSTLQPPTTVEPAKLRNKRTENVWRSEARNLRDRVARAAADSAGLSARLDALDAGPSTPAALQERALVATALNRMRADENALREQLGQFEAQAQASKVPADWIR